MLKWIRSSKDLPVFVRNRVNEISEDDNITFNCIPTKQNPADTTSHGTTLKKLKQDQLWWHGPKWLINPVCEWPESDDTIDRKADPDFESELKIKTQFTETGFMEISEKVDKPQTYDSGITAPLGIDSKRYSSVTKMLRVTVFVSSENLENQIVLDSP